MCAHRDEGFSNREFKKKEYWDQRFEEEEAFDWFHPYKAFAHKIRHRIKPTDRILMLGCGNSSLSRDMYDDGFPHITNLDFSHVVIQKMAEKHRDCPEMSWVCMDMLNMTFPEGSFDVVIEKGTIDALLVEQRDPWKPSEDIVNMMDKCCGEISKVMKKEGSQFLSITFGQPHFRKPFLSKAKFQWSVDFVTFGEEFHYFIYVVKKGPSEKVATEEDIKSVMNLKVDYFDNTSFQEVTDDTFFGKIQDGLFAVKLEE